MKTAIVLWMFYGAGWSWNGIPMTEGWVRIGSYTSRDHCVAVGIHDQDYKAKRPFACVNDEMWVLEPLSRIDPYWTPKTDQTFILPQVEIQP